MFQPHGSIEIIMGPMFSGKSTELYRRIQRHRVTNMKCIVLKFKGDLRYSDQKMTTHDQL